MMRTSIWPQPLFDFFLAVPRHVVATHDIYHGMLWNDCRGMAYGKRQGNRHGTSQQAPP